MVCRKGLSHRYLNKGAFSYVSPSPSTAVPSMKQYLAEMGTTDGIFTSAQISRYPADSLTIDGPSTCSSGASEQ